MKLAKIIGTGILIFVAVLMPCAEMATSDIYESEGLDYIDLAQKIHGSPFPQQESEPIIKIYEETDDYVYTVAEGASILTLDDKIEVVAAAKDTRLHRVAIGIQGNYDKIEIDGEVYLVDHNMTLSTIEPSTLAIDISTQIKYAQICAEDLRYMASIIWAEAGNQCEAGQQAVGIVVMNRVNSDIYENTVKDVIYESGQFTPISSGSFKKALALYDNGEIPESIIEAAKYALIGNTTIVYNDMVYDLSGYLYFSRYIYKCKIKVEDHCFA